ncbi:Rsd/AlgQ family anti-sigma factor [Tolumonas lignilytica]|uniref:Rsd/AlgQ family anti-sigma factor n=1 Tax=Tolumonas lignilytica TaxID=1283284 RepID=UPI000465E33C|nr:Rsd/AlgQ family anti-sigma factor [Tolumonas lignilytica]
MLVNLDKIRQQVAGKHPAIDAWLNVRRNLLVEYMQLAGLMPPYRKTLPDNEALSDFCGRLVDYVSAGHFEIYEILIDAYEKIDGRHLSLTNRLIDRIQDTTEAILDFNERYSDIKDDELPELETDLSQLGLTLEERFKLEDKLVLVLDVLNNGELLEQTPKSATTA